MRGLFAVRLSVRGQRWSRAVTLAAAAVFLPTLAHAADPTGKAPGAPSEGAAANPPSETAPPKPSQGSGEPSVGEARSQGDSGALRSEAHGGDDKEEEKPKTDGKDEKKDDKKDDKKDEPKGPPPPKRPLPDYGGRGPKPTTAGDVALTTVRVVVSPLYFVSEYMVRRPLEVIVPALETSSIPKSLYDFFLFGPDHKAGVVPTFLADFGLRPSVGIYAFWNDAFVPRHNMIVHGSTWGEHWLAGGFTDRYVFDKGSTDNESFSVTAVARPDHPFYGIGPRSLQSAESRYGGTKIEIMESIDKHLDSHITFHGQMGMRAEDFYDGDNIGNDPTIAQAIHNGTVAAPPGYSQNYTLFTSSMRLGIDSRGAKTIDRTGLRLDLGGEHDASLRDGAQSGWVKYGGALTAALDLGGRHRVLSFTATTLFVDPMRGDVVVPFTELVSLGGLNPMRAYLAGRMIDRSAAVGTFEYRWPVWNAFDGSIKAEFGNVFDAHLSDFAMNLLRFSGSIGLQTSGPTDNPLQVIFGVGSETFEHGGQIDSFRLFIGTTTNGL